MYKDIISYELAENISEEHLLKISKQIITEWMKNLPGFISWEIHSGKDGVFTDVVCWESRESAKNAEKEMTNIPNANDWYSCYKEGSISCKNLNVIARF